MDAAIARALGRDRQLREERFDDQHVDACAQYLDQGNERGET